jgi:hypothetical protein
MTNIINLPDFSGATTSTITLLDAGTYTLEIREIRQQTIKGGRYEGQPVLNVGLATSTNVWVWKQLPMFEPDAEDTKGLTWLRMSTMAFAKAVNAKGKLDLDKLVGVCVDAEVGVQPRADRPDEAQNFIKTFVAVK